MIFRAAVDRGRDDGAVGLDPVAQLQDVVSLESCVPAPVDVKPESVDPLGC